MDELNFILYFIIFLKIYFLTLKIIYKKGILSEIHHIEESMKIKCEVKYKIYYKNIYKYKIKGSIAI